MLMDNHARFFRRLFEFTSEELDRGGANSFEKNEKCIKEFFAILKDCNMLVD